MFRVTICPSSGETTVFMWQVSHKYSYFSWWWARSHLKPVEQRNKHIKKYCAPSWLYLQDQYKTLILTLQLKQLFLQILRVKGWDNSNEKCNMSLCEQSALTFIPLYLFLTKHYLLKSVQAKSLVNNSSLQIKRNISRIWLFFLAICVCISTSSETPWEWRRGVKTYRIEHYIKRKYCDVYLCISWL